MTSPINSRNYIFKCLLVISLRYLKACSNKYVHLIFPPKLTSFTIFAISINGNSILRSKKKKTKNGVSYFISNLSTNPVGPTFISFSSTSTATSLAHRPSFLIWIITTASNLAPYFPDLSLSVYSKHRNHCCVLQKPLLCPTTMRVTSCYLCAQNSPVDFHNTQTK